MTTNPSGLRPFANMLLIKPDETDKTTAGGLLLPDEFRDKKNYKTSRGVVVALGHAAFMYGGGASPDIPEIGDRVIFKVYEGSWEEGIDGNKYLLISDEQVIGAVA